MATARPKAKAPKEDHSLLYTVGIALLCLVLGFVLVSSRLNYVPKAKPTVAYANFGPAVVRINGYAFSANLAVQTSTADAKWLKKNKNTLNDLLQAELAKADPQQLRTPNGLLLVQESLKHAINTAFNADHVQSVLFTDFVMTSDEE